MREVRLDHFQRVPLPSRRRRIASETVEPVPVPSPTTTIVKYRTRCLSENWIPRHQNWPVISNFLAAKIVIYIAYGLWLKISMWVDNHLRGIAYPQQHNAITDAR